MVSTHPKCMSRGRTWGLTLVILQTSGALRFPILPQEAPETGQEDKWRCGSCSREKIGVLAPIEVQGLSRRRRFL